MPSIPGRRRGGLVLFAAWDRRALHANVRPKEECPHSRRQTGRRAPWVSEHGVDSWMMKLLRDWGGGGVFVAGERQQGNEIVQTLIPLSAAFSSKSL